MNILIALATGALFTGGLYMMMRRSLVRVLVGILLLGNAINLTIFAAGRLVAFTPPIIAPGQSRPPDGVADPLTQALILTAIVISFGITAFAVALVRQTYSQTGTDDLDLLRCTDVPCPPEPDWEEPQEGNS
ncbi:multisubunit sodium/proton antiporter, MrpC subunit [Anaerolinea thermolimosa]|uniref:sodium:proton antiporter n=1 Tax=Anaerolinea thermolimosa TaxID=229919 RepID=UPI000785DD5E|nr:NADH-quinone oxidoreductase subunit K [Anaerolinea thermolimosa]GAP08112.1 multisubunit sodium/proton antiporter, MrpC subunit [Anaerolinea thermolimosa]